MAQESFLKFLLAVRESSVMLTCYNQRNLSELLFHAKNEGFDFTAEEVAEVVGKLETNVVQSLDRDPFNETSRLWGKMWGMYHLEYFVNHVVRRHTDQELQALIENREVEGL